MLKSIKSTKKADKKNSIVYIVDNVEQIKNEIPKERYNSLSKKENKLDLHQFESGEHLIFIITTADEVPSYQYLEKLRVFGNSIFGQLKNKKSSTVSIEGSLAEDVCSVAEGIALSAYNFDKYLTKKDDFKLTIQIVNHEAETQELSNVVNGVSIAKDLVNEPQNYLTAKQYSKDIKKLGKDAGFTVKVLNKTEIEKLGMGGFLAVNQGSVEEPTFNIMEYKPKNAVNKNPIVLVGKGVVYDTGGLSLKPTPNSMDIMKCDMAGSAAVVGAMHAISTNQLNVHVVGLVAATDNRPSLNAYAPGDVITMMNKNTVEVLNTDAEGRLTLGDAITYAQKFKPELIIDVATLTGAAARAIGKQGTVMMGTASKEMKSQLEESGYRVHERLVEFPLWEEYKDELKSDIADFTNLGGAEAGATTAGIFLQYFAEDTPWIHLDIAGTAWLGGADKYRNKNATGVGVRLFYDFIKNR